jgi:RNA polymerase sigma factor (sigma-70 family)
LQAAGKILYLLQPKSNLFLLASYTIDIQTTQFELLTELHAIISGCIANDRKSQKQLYERYYGYAFKIAFRYIYRYDRVADVVNDGFVKLFRNIAQFVSPTERDTEPRLMAWIKKIVVNTAIDELRKHNLMPEIGGIPDGAWEEPGNSAHADNALLYKELICHVKSLPPSYGAVFNMYVIDGFTHQEIADQLGISVGTSKSNLFKAKAYLQKLINKDAQQAGICNI